MSRLRPSVARREDLADGLQDAVAQVPLQIIREPGFDHPEEVGASRGVLDRLDLHR